MAAKAMLQQPGVERVLVLDCDVHQGDGTAAILADCAAVFTCSIHCQKNFPVRKRQSDLDVALPDGIEDKTYLDIVEQTLHQCLDIVQPDIVFFDAGVDVYRGDPLGRASVSEQGIVQRERLVLSTLKRRGIPVATVIGGGYDDDRWQLAKRHAIVVEQAIALHRASWSVGASLRQDACANIR